MSTRLQPGKLVSLRGREWVVLPSDDPELLIVKPLGGSDAETAGIYLPLDIKSDRPVDASTITHLESAARDRGEHLLHQLRLTWEI